MLLLSLFFSISSFAQSYITKSTAPVSPYSNSAIYQTSANLVGIGTTAPTANLSIASVSSTTPTMLNLLNGTTSTPYSSLPTSFSIVRSGYITIGGTNYSGTTTDFIINSSGQVGIGTASPAYTLDVAGFLRSTQAAYFNSSITVTGESYLEGGAEIFGNSLVSGQWLVGGTTFPSSGKLIVESSTGTNLDLLNNGYAGWSNQIRFLNSSATVRHLIYDDNTGSSSKTNGELVIIPGYYGNATNTLNIQGQVQIGTDRPVTSTYTPFALSVYGNVVAQQVLVETSDWSDFVFDKGYKLPALSDVEAYVNHNKHLPDVPSECEATEKGVNLGEMNKVLLQKVEELTLYMIQQQKEIDALKAQK